ncbi:MAG: nucleotidyl transferase AbiEii/AbiGii toxin family protein [Coriobacteriia bacterium]|nr:nucleotidyl transferase AbiEii/AbiGii toxin family protein [Coriobacteriia bacterium]
MINLDAIIAWGKTHPWPSLEQVEQDLLISRAVCEIASDSYLSKELVFRGGTALNKLFTKAAYRYSEDLDYVRLTDGGIGQLLSALRSIGEQLGFTVSTKIAAHPKVIWKTVAQNGIPIRIKIEINTHERVPALPPKQCSFSVDSRWWSGSALVQTYQLSELMASKLRALYQRSKGRDLFDIWLALEHLEVDSKEVLAVFPLYRPEGLTSQVAIDNLDAKLANRAFRIDLDALVSSLPREYSIEVAAELVKSKLLSKL